jgi:hypothetical protein
MVVDEMIVDENTKEYKVDKTSTKTFLLNQFKTLRNVTF